MLHVRALMETEDHARERFVSRPETSSRASAYLHACHYYLLKQTRVCVCIAYTGFRCACRCVYAYGSRWSRSNHFRFTHHVWIGICLFPRQDRPVKCVVCHFGPIMATTARLVSRCTCLEYFFFPMLDVKEIFFLETSDICTWN